MTFTKLPKSITAEELLSTPLPPVKWIIPGLLPAGLALFAGPSKAGKSWLTLWLCLQIAQGNPVWNREIEPRTVVYFSLEDTFNRLQNRIFQLIDGGDAPERLILQTECPSIGQGLEEQVDSLIHTYRDVGLIVIDTLQKVRVSDGNGGMYANDYKEAGALKKLADKYGICILLIHHLRKQSASDPFDQISGFTGLMGVADTSWVMQRKRMSQTADILLTGRDMDDRTLHLREENCVWTLEDEETAEEREIKAVPDYLWKAAEYIESVGNWQGTASELLAAAGIENAKPNQFTYNMAKYFDKVFEPKNIRYKTHRKSKVRLLNFYGDDDTFTRHLRKLYRQCGLPEDYHLHTLRYFYATYLLQEGTSKQVAASLLGHADTAFLERTYCHPQDIAKRQAANLMQDLLNSQNPCYVAFMKNKNRKVKKAG